MVGLLQVRKRRPLRWDSDVGLMTGDQHRLLTLLDALVVGDGLAGVVRRAPGGCVLSATWGTLAMGPYTPGACFAQIPHLHDFTCAVIRR